MQKSDRINDISEWFQTKEADRLIEQETTIAKELVSNLFGYHVAQLGSFYPSTIINSSRISNRILVSIENYGYCRENVCCDAGALPFAEMSIDLLILPHVIEFSGDAARILREADRVLISEGYLIVFGLNPWSFFGASALLKKWQELAPWNCNFISAKRLRDWLLVLGFEIVRLEYVGFGSLSGSGPMGLAGNTEKLMKYLVPKLGNAYILVAKKRVEGMTLSGRTLLKRRKILKGGIVKPTASRTEISNE